MIPKTNWKISDEKCSKGLVYLERRWKSKSGTFTERKLVGEGQVQTILERIDRHELIHSTWKEIRIQRPYLDETTNNK